MLSEEEKAEARRLYQQKRAPSAGGQTAGGLTDEEREEARQLLQAKQFSEAEEQATAPTEPGLEERRRMVGEGQTLQVGVPFTDKRLDTGVPLPQGATEFLAGMGRRAQEIVSLGTNMGDKTANELLDDSGYATAGGVGADILAMSVAGAAAAGTRAAGAVNAVTNPSNLAKAVGGGAAYGAATTDDRLSGAVAGGIGGGIGQGVTAGLAKAVRPAIRPEARKLVEDGVDLTPGQLMGGRAQVLEDKAMSAPLMGESIAGARERSLASYNRKVVNDALAEIGEKVDARIPVGRDSIQAAQDKVSSRYSQTLEDMDVTLDDLFNDTVEEIGKEVTARFPKGQRKAFEFEVEEILRAVQANDGVLPGPEFKRVDSSLRQVYKKMLRSDDSKKVRLGEKLRELHDSLLALGKRQHPERAGELANLDRAYAKLSVVENAAGYDGAASNDGVFTPSMLWRAAKKQTGRKALAGGRGYGQRETEAARDILGQKVPDSGTAGRLLPWAIGAGATYADPTVALGLGAGAAAYTSPAQRAIRAMLMNRPQGAQATRGALEQVAPYLGRAGTAAGINSR